MGETSMDLNALIQAGYTADYGNLTSSDHGFTFGGNANLTGFLLQPQFPFLHRQPLLQPVAGQLQLASISRQQRGERQREHLLRQQLPWYHQL